MGGRELQYRAFQHVIFADGLLALGGESLESRGKVVAGLEAAFSSWLFRGCVPGERMGEHWALRGSRVSSATEAEFAESSWRAVLSSNKMVASLVNLALTSGRMRAVGTDCWRESQVVVSPLWRTDQTIPATMRCSDNSHPSANSSTIATAYKQCQT